MESIFEVQAKGELPSVGVDQYSLTQGAERRWLGLGFNVPSENLLNSYDPNDLRRDATIIFRGETLMMGDLYLRPLLIQCITKSLLKRIYRLSANRKNIRILRYAEVLLMNAEAASNLEVMLQVP